MTLKKFLKKKKFNKIALLMFNNQENVISYMYDKNEFEDIPKDLLKMEVMDRVQEDDCMEIWLM